MSERRETTEAPERGPDFIRSIIKEDLRTGKHGTIVTRFPPEPNGYLHIGHAKSICLNFGAALEHGGRCHMRFDDTNPLKEDVEYVEAILRDVRWLGFDWGEHLHFASDYFEKLHDDAVELIRMGKAYVDSLSAEEIREHRGTLTEPGRESPHRNRPVEESLDLFRRMRAGEFADGEHVLRARIDMTSGNINMRDPTIFRIRKASHHRTGNAWCIYPMYDYTHCLSDAYEGITHSICTLEFEDHRPLYDWVLDTLKAPCHPQQIEFARLNLTYTLMSKRKLLRLVSEGFVRGWDDPRMPTLAGMRRRGYPPEAIRTFCERIGVAKRDSMVDFAVLEHAVREELNRTAPRAMAVLRPVKVVLTNYPEGKEESLDLPRNPEDPSQGTRSVPFGRELFIEEEDFREEPPPKYFRLAPGREVRLRGGYFVRCTGVAKDGHGRITEIQATYDPETRGGSAPDGRKVKATIHWVPARHAVPAEVRLYGHLFTTPTPDAADDVASVIDPASFEALAGARVEPALAAAAPGDRFQFERQGYFCVDEDSRPGALVFNRTVTLKDAWVKIEKGKPAA